MSSKKISLPIGILATMNVMFGTGVLINTTLLLNVAGFYGFLAYVMVGVLLMPLLYVFTSLLNKYPEGGLFLFSKDTLGKNLAFLSAWAYFTGKLASGTLLIHVFSLFFLQIAPFPINIFILDIAILLFFIGLNYFGMTTGKMLTWSFFTLKLIPVLVTIVASLFMWQDWQLPTQPIPYTSLIAALPLVLYAFLGFEAACSLSIALENPQKNATTVLLTAFGATVALTILYQVMIYLGLSSTINPLGNYIDAFNVLFAQLPISKTMQSFITFMVYLSSGCAALGGSYAILMSNTWNLYTLALYNHIPFAQIFTRKNRFGVPFACVLIQGSVCLYYFITTGAQQVILQQISVLGCSFALLISCISFLKMQTTLLNHNALLSLLATISASLLMLNCFKSIFFYQPLYLWLYILILIIGFMFMKLKSK